jgi:hypothetical protein
MLCQLSLRRSLFVPWTPTGYNERSRIHEKELAVKSLL